MGMADTAQGAGNVLCGGVRNVFCGGVGDTRGDPGQASSRARNVMCGGVGLRGEGPQMYTRGPPQHVHPLRPRRFRPAPPRSTPIRQR